ncbi:MAG: manganese efflux pump [Bacteroidetes bacterium]|nr:manganese efflux pump [Bacteroidota bacterium]
MDLLTIIFVAFALSMDAFVVSMIFGLKAGENKTKIALKAGAFFGFFQAVMPLLGWTIGFIMKSATGDLINDYDHWVAFGLLLLIGLKMIHEATKNKHIPKGFNTGSIWVMLTLSVATSIDALAVGVSFALIKIHILLAAAIIGIITFGVSFVGVSAGKKLCGFLGNKTEVAGGIILILIGLKILIEHLFFQ